jgi:hypothetical protein
MTTQPLNTTLRRFYDSHAADCSCFACVASRRAIEELGGRCSEHGVVRAVCRCPQPEKQPA